MHGWARDLFPICRSITGPGVRETLAYLRERLPELDLKSVPSGSEAFDWLVPPEWEVDEAWIEDDSGTRVVDFADHNLHVVGYSEPVDCCLELDELQTHLHSLPEQPDAIPYVTSYYERRWGFCLTQSARDALRPGRYRAIVRSRFSDGHLDYGEVLLPGRSEREVLFSTYLCHPSMANNELSGPVVLLALAQHVAALEDRRYSYRFVFAPETIGSIVYISRNLDVLRERVLAAFNVTCCGDERAYSWLPSRLSGTLSDRLLEHVLAHTDPGYLTYDWFDRGSDERQYCSPGVDLPMATFCRSKFHCYPEYHTSLDDLELVTPAGLAGSLAVLCDVVAGLEGNAMPMAVHPCEPQLGRRGLYPSISTRGSAHASKLYRNVLSCADGREDLLAIAERLGEPLQVVLEAASRLADVGLLQLDHFAALPPPVATPAPDVAGGSTGPIQGIQNP